MEHIWAGLKDGEVFPSCCSGIVCVHCGGLVNTPQAHVAYYHPSQVKFLGVGSITRAVPLLSHLVNETGLSPVSPTFYSSY